MARVFNCGRQAIWNGQAIPGTATLKARLLMSNTNAGSVADSAVSHVSDITSDTCDSVGYADATLASAALTRVDASTLVKLVANTIDWGSLPASTRTIVGVLIYVFITNDAGSIPLVYDTFASAKTLDGSDFQTPPDSTYGFGYIN